jgi:hypothetical protein
VKSIKKSFGNLVFINPRTSRRVGFVLKAEISVFISVHRFSVALNISFVEGKLSVLCRIVRRTHYIYETASLAPVLLDFV